MQKNHLDRRQRTLRIDAWNESFSSRLSIKEFCHYYVSIGPSIRVDSNDVLPLGASGKLAVDVFRTECLVGHQVLLRFREQRGEIGDETIFDEFGQRKRNYRVLY